MKHYQSELVRIQDIVMCAELARDFHLRNFRQLAYHCSIPKR